MATTKVFKNGNSQALRIPSEMHTEKKEYIIKKIGEIFIAYPAEDPWLPLKQATGTFPDDYMNERNQPGWVEIAEREEI